MGRNAIAHLEYDDMVTGIRSLARVHFSRNYDLFALMGGVRNFRDNGPLVPVIPPRGLPEDISIPTKFARIKSRGNQVLGETWFSATDLEEIQRYYTKKNSEGHWELVAVIAAMRELPVGCVPRLVIWFED